MFKKNKKDNITAYIKDNFGLKIKRTTLFEQAFTHKSISREVNNERLEFLGDSILSAVVTSFLYDKYPSKNEGDLSKLTAKIVNRQHLNKLGEVSYGIYMYHIIVIYVVITIGNKWLDQNLFLSELIFYGLVLPLLFICSFLSYNLFEKKLLNMKNLNLKKKF